MSEVASVLVAKLMTSLDAATAMTAGILPAGATPFRPSVQREGESVSMLAFEGDPKFEVRVSVDCTPACEYTGVRAQGFAEKLADGMFTSFTSELVQRLLTALPVRR